MEGLAVITDLVDQYRIIEEVYVHYTHPIKKGDLGNAIVNLYQNILEYQAQATCYYSLKTSERTFRNIAKQDNWLEKVGKIEDCNKTCRNIMGVTGFEHLKNSLEKQTQQLDKIREAIRKQDKENEEIAAWISSFPVEIEHDDIRHQKLQSHLCPASSWLLQDRAFLEWQAATSGVFWLRGSVGTGKTCAVCIVIEHLLERAGTERIAFFYCSKTQHSPEMNESNKILGSLLAQLAYTTDAAGGETIHPSVKAKYENMKVRGRELDQDDCSNLLIEVTKLNQQTIIVIDALDEGPGGQSSDLLFRLQRISKESPAVKFFFSSRMEVRLSQYFPHTMNVTVTGEGNFQDIELFIINRIFDPKNLVSEEVKASIQMRYKNEHPRISSCSDSGSGAGMSLCGMTPEQGLRLVQALMGRANGM